MKGAEAAALFYDNDKFIRGGAMPARVQKTLVGVGGVQSLDHSAHQHRKNLFIAHLMHPDQINALADLHRRHWQATLLQWPIQQEMVLFDQAQRMLCKSVCAWAGVPLPEAQLSERARQFGHMIDAGARIGLAHWRGRLSRKSIEKWIQSEIKNVRKTEVSEPATLLQAFACHRDEQGALLTPEIAAVELINVLRPAVAIATLATFSALALHHYPNIRKKLHENTPHYLDWFICELRRFYPFFPFLAAYTDKDFTWKGFEFKKGTLTLLDIYATHHDPQAWQNPHAFYPERFAEHSTEDFRFIANGGGRYDLHHRCPGEWITQALLKVIVELLVNDLQYTVPAQDLSVSLQDIPTLPRSRMVIKPLRYQHPLAAG